MFSEYEPKPVITQVTLEMATAMEQVARRMHINFDRLAEAGQEFRTLDGGVSTITPGYALVRLQTRIPDLTKFWDKVDKICPPSYKR